MVSVGASWARGRFAGVPWPILALLALVAGCDKPGDQAGGTARERSMASPKTTPTPSRPEPSPASYAARAPAVSGPTASASKP